MVVIVVSLTSAVPESVANTPFDPVLSAVSSLPSMMAVEPSPTTNAMAFVP